MATYYSHLLNRAISYDKNLINPKEIQEIIEYCFEFQISPFLMHSEIVEKWNPAYGVHLFHCLVKDLDKKEKYFYKMCKRIQIMYIKKRNGEK